MEARFIRPLVGLATVLGLCINTVAQTHSLRAREHVAHSQNFIVFASSPQWAAQVAQVAEQNRRDLAIYWLGQELPPWSERCPIHVQSGPRLLAGGETTFSLLPHGAGAWGMSVQGTPERVLDSVLPHEITHTIFATYFAPTGKYVPRWADEGACTTVEHEAEKSKHAHYLQEFLRTGRGLSFNKMLSLKEYPNDILPLYAQGHSAVQFLIDQRGAREFVKFLESGMRTDAWEQALQQHYAYETLGQFQKLWNRWLAEGSPDNLISYAPIMQGQSSAALAGSDLASNQLAAANPRSDTSLEGRAQFAIGNTQPTPAMLASSIGPDANATGLSLSDSNGNRSFPADRSGLFPEQVEHQGNASWYKRRLLEASGNERGGNVALTPINGAILPASPPVNSGPSPQTPVAPGALQPQTMRPQSTARPFPSQEVDVQVLDWGNSAPIPGVEPSGNPRWPLPTVQMVPILR